MNTEELPMYKARPPHWARPNDEYFRAYLPPEDVHDSDWLNIAKCALERRRTSIPDWKRVDREHQSFASCLSRIDINPDRFAKARP